MATTNIELDIENITGVSDADDQFIVSAQKFVVASVPKNLLKFAQTASSASTDGGAISYTRNDSIIDVQRNGYSCKEIPFSESVWSTTTGSLKKATSSFPVYWHQNDGVKIAPATDGSNAGYIFYVSSSKIDDDCDLRNVVIFHAASSEFTKLASSKVTDWSDLTLPVSPSAPDFGSDLSMSSVSPVAPSSPSFTYTDASVSDIVKPLISISDMASMTESAPSYTKPVMSLGSTPTISDLSISSVPPVSPSISDNSVSFSTSAPTFVKPTPTSQVAFNDYWTLSDFGDSDPGVLTISNVVPSVPSLTSVTFTSIDSALDTVAPTYTTATVSASSVYTGSAPSYTAPVLSLTTFPTITWTFPSVPVAPPSPSFSTPAIGSITVDSTMVYNDGTPPTYTAPAVGGATEELTASMTSVADDTTGTDVDFKDFSKWFTAVGEMIEDEEDTELAQAQLQKINAYIQSYSQAMQNQLNTFNDANVEYQAKLQEGIQQAQINAQKAQSQSQIDATEAQQETSLLLQKENQEYAASLQNFSASVQNYQAEVNKVTTGNQAEIGEWQQRNSVDIQKYGTDTQNAVNTFNKENIAYQSAIQESMQEIQIANQVNMAQSQSDLQAATSNKDRDLQRQLQNGTNDMQAIINDNNRKISLYQAEAQTYQSDTSKQVQEYTQKLSRYQLELNTVYTAWAKTESDNISKYQADIQNEQALFNENNVEYQAQLQISIQDAQLSSQDDAQKLSKYASELQSYQSELNKEIQEYQQNLAGDLQVWNQERQTDLQKYASDIQNEVSEFNKENVVYQQDIQRKVQNLQKDTQEAVQNAQNDIAVNNNNLQKDVQISLQNAVQDFQQDVQEYSAKVQKYNSELNQYQQDINKEVQDFVNTLNKESQEYQNKIALYNADLQKYQAEVGEKTQKIGSATQNSTFYSNESKKYYEWSQLEINSYIKNNSKMINQTMAAQAAAQQQRS